MGPFVTAAVVCGILLSGVVGASRDSEGDVTGPRAVAQATNQFAADVYSELKTREGNLFFSPYGAYTALAITYAGARGRTADQMADVLHVPSDDPDWHSRVGALMRQIQTAGNAEGCILTVANALWLQEHYGFQQGFVELIRQCYAGELRPADFKSDPSEACQRINAWVAEQTRGRIKEIVSPRPEVLDELTRLILVNAVYFKGLWRSSFHPQQTSDAPFWVGPDTSVQVAMMRQQFSFPCGECESCHILSMPYTSRQLAMTILLPRQRDGLRNLEDAITAEQLSEWLGTLEQREVRVFIPRFNITRQIPFEGILRSLGIRDAFTLYVADFTGIATEEPLYLSAASQKTFVGVTEEGTEALAVSHVVTRAGSHKKWEVFRADHPFLFLIQHVPTGTVLFMGRVTNPAEL